MGRRTAALYLAAVAVSALAAGLILDCIFALGTVPAAGGTGWMIPGWLKTASAVVLVVLLGAALFRGASRGVPSERCKGGVMLTIEGMTCDHCARTVREAPLACPNVESVEVDPKTGKAVVVGEGLNVGLLTRAVGQAGYEARSAERREGPGGRLPGVGAGERGQGASAP